MVYQRQRGASLALILEWQALPLLAGTNTIFMTGSTACFKAAAHSGLLPHIAYYCTFSHIRLKLLELSFTFRSA